MQSQFCSAPVSRFNGSAAKLVQFATGDQEDQHGEADPREVLSPGIMAKIVDNRAEHWRPPGGHAVRKQPIQELHSQENIPGVLLVLSGFLGDIVCLGQTGGIQECRSSTGDLGWGGSGTVAQTFSRFTVFGLT